MSTFICAKCGGFADSDDGCEERNGQFFCADCLDNEPDQEDDQ